MVEVNKVSVLNDHSLLNILFKKKRKKIFTTRNKSCDEKSLWIIQKFHFLHSNNTVESKSSL